MTGDPRMFTSLNEEVDGQERITFGDNSKGKVKGLSKLARLEAIRILLAYASHHEMKLYQMDVKSAFLNGFINELVYVHQPSGIEDPKYPNHVYRLSKALYGLKQAPRAWYERLRDFLIEKGFTIGKVDTTLFTKKLDGEIFICQVMLLISYLAHQMKVLQRVW